MTTQYRVYKLRLYPNNEQEKAMYQQATAQRFVWNWALDTVNKHYEETGKRLRAMDLNKIYTQAKRDREDMRWLDKATEDNPGGAGISVPACQMTFRNLDTAWDAFFKGLKAGRRVGKPRFKSKHNTRPSMAWPVGVYTDGTHVFIPKVGKVRYRGYDDLILDKHGEATVTFTPSGQWYLSKLVKIEAPDVPVIFDADNVIGIEVGVRELVVTTDGQRVANPKHLARRERKLMRLDRALSRCEKGSNRREVARKKRARAYQRVADARREFTHELSHQLIVEHDGVITRETGAANMVRRPEVKAKKLSKSINDAAWTALNTQLAYKAEWNGKVYVRVPADTKSTATCSVCGTISATIRLEDTHWTCIACNTRHDREVNAATIIRSEGLRTLTDE